jgi:hypothetical protein
VRRSDRAPAGAEPDAGWPVAGMAAKGDGVAVFQPGEGTAVGEVEGRASPLGGFEEAPGTAGARVAHRAGGEEVAGAQAGTVRGEVGDLLGDGPVHPGERGARYELA